jgi:transcription antitermination factor NusG
MRSNFEHLVEGQLAAKGFHTFLPQLPCWSAKGRGQQVVRTPMFPGYLFVRDTMDKERYIDILKVRGIVRVLEDGWTRLTPVPDDAISALKTIVAADIPVFPCAHLQHGDRVRVIAEPLAGLEGIFVQDKSSKGRLVVSVDLLGRSVAVEVDVTAVEACAPRHQRKPDHAFDHRHHLGN